MRNEVRMKKNVTIEKWTDLQAGDVWLGLTVSFTGFMECFFTNSAGRGVTMHSCSADHIIAAGNNTVLREVKPIECEPLLIVPHMTGWITETGATVVGIEVPNDFYDALVSMTSNGNRAKLMVEPIDQGDEQWPRTTRRKSDRQEGERMTVKIAGLTHLPKRTGGAE